MDLSREPSTSFNFAQYYTDISKVIPKTYFLNLFLWISCLKRISRFWVINDECINSAKEVMECNAKVAMETHQLGNFVKYIINKNHFPYLWWV